MKQLSLNGSWNLFKANELVLIPATVPGCIHTDLLANNLLEDPFTAVHLIPALGYKRVNN
jgi:beta-mannosidase